MKLRNKKTGEIINSKDLFTDEFIIDLFSKSFSYFDTTIDKIQEEWEVFEEDRKYWYIDDGEIKSKELGWFNQAQNNIGNCFETEEEAEKAVEKLKAWKRLKDNGFKLKGWYMPKSVHKIEIDGGFSDDVSLSDFMDDIDKIFGGE